MPHTLPTVRVEAEADPAPVAAARAQATTTIHEAVLRQRQPVSVFELLDEVPGVATQGGPRPSGMRFNIRGYTDAQDVRTELDGVGKGFEKYRFGGTFVEPELLKSITVRRGAQVETPAGALGGTVSLQTRDAADLLRPGQQWGARARVAHGINNDETHVFTTAYGKPAAGTDVVVAQSRRSSNNIRLADGNRLPLSDSDAGSTLLKGSWWMSDEWRAQLSWIRYRDQGLQPYDTTGGLPGTFGQVQRQIEDNTTALQLRWADEALGHSWQTTLGHSRTRVRDHMAPGWSVFSTLTEVNDDVDHQQATLDSRLNWTIAGPPDGADHRSLSSWHLRANAGIQAGQGDRAARRVTGLASLNQALYAGGHNPAQPSGHQDRIGGFAQIDLGVGAWQLLPGLRWDRFDTRVSDGTAALLQAAGQSTSLTAQRISPSLTLAHTVADTRWSTFATVAHAFRPPLLDEAFARSAFGSCNNAYLLRTSEGGVPGYGSGANVAPASGVCAEAYVPEVSRSLQLGISTPQLKLTAFDDRTRHVLTSLMAASGGSGLLVQPGTEHRWGWELEGSWRTKDWQVRVQGHRIEGRSFDGLRERALLTTPADRLQLSLGWQQPWGGLSLRWQQQWARRYFTDNTRTTTARQPSHRLLGAWVQWQINRHMALDLAAENLTNADHRLDNGFAALGVPGAGRNLRVALSARY